MNRFRWEEESTFLERVASYREEYRSDRVSAMNEESERRHAGGEVYFAGCWVPRTEAERLVRGFQRQEVFAIPEILALLVALLAIAWGIWWLFTLLMLPT